MPPFSTLTASIEVLEARLTFFSSVIVPETSIVSIEALQALERRVKLSCKFADITRGEAWSKR